MSTVIGFIPARGGSKGLPGKNIKVLNGKPLIAYTIEAAKDSQVFEQVVVSSEDEEILAVTKQYGADIDRRPSELAQDETSTDQVIEDFIQRHQIANDTVIVVLQPTSPLRTARHIEEALQWFLENKCNCLVSVKTINPMAMFAYVENQQYLEPLTERQAQYSQRQQLPTLYLPNGAIYIFKVGDFSVENKIPSKGMIPFVMSDTESVDIDVEDDLRRCSHYLAGLPERRDLL